MSSDVLVSATPPRERIGLLDVLRGFSILGIAVDNVPYFAVPLARLMDWQWAGVSLSEGLVRLAATFLSEEKFLFIFSVLFGMGLALQDRREREAGRDLTKLYVRRLLVLFAFGLVHGILIWYGDILALYAVLGFIVFWLRNRSPRTLLITALAVFMVPVVIQILLGLAGSGGREVNLEEKKNSIITEFRKQLAGSPTSVPAAGKGRPTASEQKAEKAKVMLRVIDFMADDQRIYGTGTLKQIILHRSIIFLFFSPLVAIAYVGWKVLAAMLLGMYLVRRGYFCETDAGPGRYLRLMIFGLVFGIVLQAASLVISGLHPDQTWANILQFGCFYVGKTGLSLGYMGLIALLYQHAWWRGRLEPLADAGRMSLTNYIGTSFLAGLIFYSYGLGLMGRVSFPMVEVIALLILAFLIVFSVIWMKFFLYGPLEWLWRVLTYLRFLPILRRPDKQ